jgi:hypothetical protein
MKQNKSNEYQQWSNHIGVWYRGTYKNGKEIGYEEWYYKKQTNFYIR